MQTATQSRSGQRMRRVGYVISALVSVVLFADGLVNLLDPAKVSAEMLATGFSFERSAVIGAIALGCAIVYSIPRTCVLGADLITGFLGGAICTHFRVADGVVAPEIVALVIGMAAWAGVYFRLDALRSCLRLVVHRNCSLR